MKTEATGLIRENGRIAGLTAKGEEGDLILRADLTIAADGRHSILRRAAGMETIDLGAPMDVLWFTLERRENEDQAVLGRIAAGEALVMLDRGDYWQCALIIRKGAAEAVKAEGLEAFRRRVARLAKRDSVEEIESLDDVKLLTVTVDRVKEWALPGFLVIGDAAHAMSPIGGIGINLAIQDAIATANLLAPPLLRHKLTLADLRKVEKRRRFPTWATQKFQIMVQNRVIDPILNRKTAPKIPRLVRLMQRFPILQRLPARLIGIGFRPEHVSEEIRRGRG